MPTTLKFEKIKNMNLLPLLFTVFIDSVGFGLVFPIYSPLIVNNESGIFSPEVSLAARGLIFGLLIGIYSLGQFFGGPLLGSLSDRYGRKKILLISMGAASISYLFGAFGIWIASVSVLFIARLLAGVSAGSFSVAQSGISDISTKENKIKNFSLVGMAFWTGFVIGPFIGGRLAGFGMMIPFFTASILCIVNCLLIQWKLSETTTPKIMSKIRILQGIQQIYKAFTMPGLRGLFAVMFVFCLGWGFFTEFSPIFLIRKLGFQVKQIANFYAWVGLWIALCQGVFIRPLLKWFSPKNLMRVGLIFMALMLPVMLFLNQNSYLFWLVPLIAIAQAMVFPAAATLVSNQTARETQGEIMGIHNSVQWAAIAIPPLFSGSFVALYPHLPITVGSGCMLIAFFIFLLSYSPERSAEE